MKNYLKTLLISGLIGGSMMGMVSCDKQSNDDMKSENAVIECIMSRKSVRQFENREVGNDTIEKILKAGMAAPTAINSQPWKFVVLKDKNLLKALADTMPNTRTQTATVAIVVCGDMTKALEGVAKEFWVQDCSAATENILLAAHSMGLGAVWTGFYPNMDKANYLNDLLGLEERYVPLCVIPIGYPAEEPEVKDKWNPENVIYK